MRNNDFMELRAFELVARRLSFSRAADEVGMTRATLSQTVKNLELRLGVRLLNRTTRSVSLTDAGYELLERLSPALNELVDAVSNIEKFRDSPSGRVRILACNLGADLYLKNLLPAFSERFPDVTIEIHIEEGNGDLISRGFDAAVRPEGQIEMAMMGVKLGCAHEQIIVASGNYIQRAGRPEQLSELENHRCIGVRSNVFGQGAAWKLENGSDQFVADISGMLIVNNHSFAMQGVLGDMGIALIPKFIAQPYLENGRVQQLIPEMTGNLPSFYLYYPKQNFATIAFRSFVDFVKETRELGATRR
jgi:DNA-binding transcriptional LysR family regulator